MSTLSDKIEYQYPIYYHNALNFHAKRNLSRLSEISNNRPGYFFSVTVSRYEDQGMAFFSEEIKKKMKKNVSERSEIVTFHYDQYENAEDDYRKLIDFLHDRFGDG